MLTEFLKHHPMVDLLKAHRGILTGGTSLGLRDINTEGKGISLTGVPCVVNRLGA